MHELYNYYMMMNDDLLKFGIYVVFKIFQAKQMGMVAILVAHVESVEFRLVLLSLF